MKWAYLVFGLLLILQSVGWILEKKGIMQITTNNPNLFSWDTARLAITNPYLVVGVSCVIMGFFCWLYLLSQFHLSYIYPLGSLLYIIVAILAYFFLGESITVTRIVGIVVIVSGCVLINL